MERPWLSIEEIKERAQKEAEAFALPDGWQDGREHVEGYAIDAQHSKDIDDAISLETADDGYTLTVSVADVGSFLYNYHGVRMLARKGGWTRYDAGRPVRPMIPTALCENKLSLLHNIDRPVLAVHTPIDHQGKIGDPTLSQAVLRAERLSYTQVDRMLAARSHKTHEHELAIQGLSRVARLMYEDRHGDGPSGDFIFDGDMPVRQDGERPSYGMFIVAQAMITANEALARYTEKHDIPALYRNYTIPPELHALRGDERQKVLRDAHVHASYSTHIEGHDALQASAYMHGTSPLRRFADFVNHHNLAAYLDGREYPFHEGKLNTIALMLNAREERSKLRYVATSWREVTIQPEHESGGRKILEAIEQPETDVADPADLEIPLVVEPGGDRAEDRSVERVQGADPQGQLQAATAKTAQLSAEEAAPEPESESILAPTLEMTMPENSISAPAHVRAYQCQRIRLSTRTRVAAKKMLDLLVPLR